MPTSVARDFVIWVHEVMFPHIREFGHLHHGRLSHILSHKDADSECFALQFEVESTARLHYWFVKQGKALGEELQKTFEGQVIGFSTMMEVVLDSDETAPSSTDEAS